MDHNRLENVSEKLLRHVRSVASGFSILRMVWWIVLWLTDEWDDWHDPPTI